MTATKRGPSRPLINHSTSIPTRSLAKRRERRPGMTPREDKKFTRNIRQAFDSAGLEIGKTGRDTLAAAIRLTDAGGRLDATHVAIAKHMPTSDTRCKTGHSDRRKAGLGMAQLVRTGFYIRTAHSHTLPGGRRCVRYTYRLAAWVMNRLKALGQLIRRRPPRKTNSLLIPTVVKKVVVDSWRTVNGRTMTLGDVFKAYPELDEHRKLRFRFMDAVRKYTRRGACQFRPGSRVFPLRDNGYRGKGSCVGTAGGSVGLVGRTDESLCEQGKGYSESAMG
jgi:hypothetical protein